MKNIIIGTAGHVDHGKTTLIRALTGTDTDRLKEEKERGMTIDLGFASLALPNGETVGVVDVPGHERFIKNMLAGAGGVDIALLVVAADESVMPQTIEHLEILQLLEVERGVVALTKADLVDKDWIPLVAEDVRKALADTFLADAPIIPVSSTTGEGLPALVDAIRDAADQVEARSSAGPFRMPVDRVFTLTGFGTVVTGTLVAGTISTNDPVEVLPSGLKSRVRQLQVHSRKVESAQAGTRVAVNLAGLEVAEIGRGDVLATPGALKASSLFDVKLNLLKDAPKPLKTGARIRFHVGTGELIGRINLLDRPELKPGEQCFAQFRSETPSAAARGDRFVIRRYSPMITIGGGVILNPVAKRHRRNDPAVLAALEAGTPREIVEQSLLQCPTGTDRPSLAKASGVADADSVIQSLISDGLAVEVAGKLIHAQTLAQLSSRIHDAISTFHDRNPLKAGMPKEELRTTAAKAFDSRGFASLLAHLEGVGEVQVAESTVRLAGREVSLSADQQAAADRMLAVLKQAGMNVPTPDDLGTRDILELLVQRGDVVKVAPDLVFHRTTVEQAEKALREYLAKNGKVTVSEFRDLVGTTRKYALPLLEYFDSKRITRRQGDFRVLGSGS